MLDLLGIFKTDDNKLINGLINFLFSGLNLRITNTRRPIKGSKAVVLNQRGAPLQGINKFTIRLKHLPAL